MRFLSISRVVIVAILVCMVQLAHSQRADSPPPVAVPDEATAVRIAEKALAKIYGTEKIKSERPFKALLLKGVWHVGGTLYCGNDEHGNLITDACLGGVAMAEVRQRDGRVLNMTHTK